jgi:hypothetical protein
MGQGRHPANGEARGPAHQIRIGPLARTGHVQRAGQGPGIATPVAGHQG